MGAGRHPAQQVLRADLGQRQRLQRAVQGGEDHQAAGRDQPRGVAQVLARIGDVLDHLHVQHHVERARAFGQQRLGGGAAVVDRQPDLSGVGARGAEAVLRRVDAR